MGKIWVPCLRGWPSRCRRGSPPWWHSAPSPNTPCQALCGMGMVGVGWRSRSEFSMEIPWKSMEIDGKKRCLKTRKRWENLEKMMMSMKNDEKPQGSFRVNRVSDKSNIIWRGCCRFIHGISKFLNLEVGWRASGYRPNPLFTQFLATRSQPLGISNTSGWTKTALADDRRSYTPLLQVNRYTQRLKNEDNRKWLNPYAQARQGCHFVYNKHYN